MTRYKPVFTEQDEKPDLKKGADAMAVAEDPKVFKPGEVEKAMKAKKRPEPQPGYGYNKEGKIVQIENKAIGMTKMPKLFEHYKPLFEMDYDVELGDLKNFAVSNIMNARAQVNGKQFKRLGDAPEDIKRLVAQMAAENKQEFQAICSEFNPKTMDLEIDTVSKNVVIKDESGNTLKIGKFTDVRKPV